MPFHTFAAPVSTDVPAPPKPPKTIVCTISETDAGDPCKFCGYASGSGHGKER